MSPETYLRYYRGSAKNIIVKADDGRHVQFPASALQGFVLQDGIQGRFRLVFDASNKFQKLERFSG